MLGMATAVARAGGVGHLLAFLLLATQLQLGHAFSPCAASTHGLSVHSAHSSWRGSSPRADVRMVAGRRGGDRSHAFGHGLLPRCLATPFKLSTGAAATATTTTTTTTMAAGDDGGSDSDSTTSASSTPRGLTLPDALTVSRVVMVPLLVALWCPPFTSLGIDPGQLRLGRAALFVAAAITDFFDGYLARKLDLCTKFGAFLDPVADKLMVAAALVLLAADWGVLVGVPAVLIISREIGVSALREWMAESGERASVAVSMAGKLKTVVQLVALSVLLGVPPQTWAAMVAADTGESGRVGWCAKKSGAGGVGPLHSRPCSRTPPSHHHHPPLAQEQRSRGWRASAC